MTIVNAVVGLKGGTSKTSLSQNLAHELATAGRRVLLVDFDPQSNLTIASGIDPAEDRPTVYNALAEPAATRGAILSLPNGVDLLPATLDLAAAESSFAGAFDRNQKLAQALGTVRADYDHILIDNNPSLGFYAFNSLAAATGAIVPLQCQPFSYRMIEPTLELIRLVQQANSELTKIRIVLTMYDRRLSLTGSVEEAARSTYGDMVARVVVPVNVSIAEATLDGVPVAVYDPSSTGAAAYAELREELYPDG